MARGRMISRTLGCSRKFALLGGSGGEFAQCVFPLLIANADDFGRLSGDAFSVKMLVFPSCERSVEEFEAALEAMVGVGLIQRYTADSEQVIQIEKFDEHQQGLKNRTASRFPAPDGQKDKPLDASEKDVENFIAAALSAGELTLAPLPAPSTIEQQARRGNAYMDILAAVGDSLVIIEVKRQKVSKAAVRQVRNYAALFPESKVVPVVIGHGVDPEAVPAEQDVLIASYDDGLNITQVSSARGITLNHARPRPAPLPQKRTEQKRTEQKRTERNGTESPVGADAPPASRHQEFIDRYFELFTDRVGSPPKFDGKKDGAIVKRLLQQRPAAEVFRVLETMFASSDAFVQNSGHDLGFLSSQYNKLLVASRASPRAAGPTYTIEDWHCEHEPRCGTRVQHRERLKLDAFKAQKGAA